MYDMITNEDSEKPDQDIMTESLKKEISRSLSTLTDRESEIVILYFGLNGNRQHSLDEVADRLELTRERVRQIREKAVRRLRHGARCRLLRSYLG